MPSLGVPEVGAARFCHRKGICWDDEVNGLGAAQAL